MNLCNAQAASQGRDSGAGGTLGSAANAGPAHPYVLGQIGFSQAVQDSMALSIVRLERENDELRAEVALLREERRILTTRQSRARTWGAEYFDTLQMLKEQRDEWHKCAEKLAEALRLEAAAEDSGFRRVGTTSALAELERLKEGDEADESERDAACRAKCRDKAAADGGWGNI